MKGKKILSLLLVLAMCLTLLAACASDADKSTDSQDTESTSDAQNEQEGTSTDDADELDDGEIIELSMYYFDLNGNASKDADSVVAAINEITEPELGIHVDITYLGMADYPTQLSLAITSGEKLDLACLVTLPAATLSTLHANGQLLDISSYLQEDYAAGLMETVGDYLDAYTYSDGIFGVPTFRIYNTDRWIMMREDILEELGMVEFAQNMTNWAQYDELLEMVYDNYNGTGLYPVCKGSGYVVLFDQAFTFPTILEGGDFSDNVAFDNLNDGVQLICTDEDGNVYNYAETDSYVASCVKAAEWYEKGWLYPDSYLAEDHGDILMKQGIAFSEIQGSEIGIEVAKKASTGYDVVCTNICPGMVTTTTLASWGSVLPVTCEEPEAAIKFLNALYTDSRLMNLLNYGIENEHYVVNDEGEACYPEGVTADSVGYHASDWIMGNQFLTLPWEGQGGDFREKALAENAKVLSPYLGFTIDTTELTDTIAALTSVSNEYTRSLYCGLYTEELYNEFLADLKTAGIDEYVAAFQAQLDAWTAEK